ncbi:MAG: HTH domain-containing protein [Paludibacter sp.]|nr:HTH domain-containing protein [Paludibacter sp.]
MFQKLISLLNSGKMYSQYELSEELGVSTETLQEYIEYLSERGFLEEVEFQKDDNCNSNRCGNCKSCKSCFMGKIMEIGKEV